jgi:hypothetical protein
LNIVIQRHLLYEYPKNRSFKSDTVNDTVRDTVDDTVNDTVDDTVNTLQILNLNIKVIQ